MLQNNQPRRYEENGKRVHMRSKYPSHLYIFMTDGIFMNKKSRQLLRKTLFLLISQIERDYVSHFKHTTIMVYSHEVENMCVVK